MAFYGTSQKVHLVLKKMTKLLLSICIFTIISFCCNNQKTKNNDDKVLKTHRDDTTKYNGLQGTWVRHSKDGFTLIEIKDTSNIMYYQFIDRKVYIDTITSDRYAYYKSKATMGYWNNPNNPYKADVDIWISTDKVRFDYKLKGDTLIEFDKIGDQGKLIKVNNYNY